MSVFMSVISFAVRMLVLASALEDVIVIRKV